MKPRYVVPLAISIAVVMGLSPYLSTIAFAGPPGIPSSIELAVAYGDTEDRGANVTACANCFPDPWCGSPGVQFVGASTNYDGNPTAASNCAGGDWDGGAMLVTNNGAASITFTGLTVTLPLPQSGQRGTPSCAEPPRPITFDLWFGQQYYYGNLSDPAYVGGPITVPAGGQAIFTGTSADGAYVCPSGNYPAGPTGGTYDFDTSDANFLSGCTVTTDTVSDPQITFSATGYAPTTYVDVGHVIDTGGIDVGNCHATTADPQWPSEDLGWRAVSSTCGEGCPTNQPLQPGNISGSAVVNSTVISPASTIASTVASSGVSSAAVYAVAAVAVVAVVALAGYGIVRRRKLP